jgi:hypothetical protein
MGHRQPCRARTAAATAQPAIPAPPLAESLNVSSLTRFGSRDSPPGARLDQLSIVMTLGRRSLWLRLAVEKDSPIGSVPTNSEPNPAWRRRVPYARESSNPLPGNGVEPRIEGKPAEGRCGSTTRADCTSYTTRAPSRCVRTVARRSHEDIHERRLGKLVSGKSLQMGNYLGADTERGLSRKNRSHWPRRAPTR